MTNKFLTIFLAVFVALSLSACQKEKSSNSSTAEVTTTTSETTETTTEIEAPVEKFEWDTVDDLSDELYLDGVQVKVPGTLEDLGEDFSYDEYDNLYYKGNIIGTVFFNNINRNNTKIDRYTSYDAIYICLSKCDFNVTFYNISKSFTKEKVIKALGNPYYNLASNYESIPNYIERYHPYQRMFYRNDYAITYNENTPEDIIRFDLDIKTEEQVTNIYIQNLEK